jgi:hypothetical protein
VPAEVADQFRNALSGITAHPSRRYFILKTIALRNLHGVDIMEEAAEIAKLRLFLKLIAQVTAASDVEPLPDLDFNIRAGNTVLGFATLDDLSAVIGRRFEGLASFEDIKVKSLHLSELYDRFVGLQTTPGGHDEEIAATKSALVSLEQALRDVTDQALAGELGVQTKDFDGWRREFLPFHWFIDFHRIMGRGGFDVVIGNPPYVSRTKVTYPIVGFETSECPDLYAPVVEQASRLVNPDSGRFAMIVPCNVSFSENFLSLRRVMIDLFAEIWVSSFGRIPAALFAADVRVRNSIIVAHRCSANGRRLWTTRCHRWNEVYRPHLFDTLRYVEVPEGLMPSAWPFLASETVAAAFDLLTSRRQTFASVMRSGHRKAIAIRDRAAAGPNGPYAVRFRTTAYNWLAVFLRDPPIFDRSGSVTEQSKVATLWFDDEGYRDLALLTFAGKWGFVWWLMYGDDFDVTAGLLARFPMPIDEVARKGLDTVTRHTPDFLEALEENVQFKLNAGKRVGTYNLNGARTITDAVDEELAKLLGTTEDVLWSLNHAFHQAVRTEIGSNSASDLSLWDGTAAN